MGTITKIIEQQMAKAPKLLLTPMIKRKFEEAGISAAPEMVDGLIDHILSKSKAPYQWSDGDDLTNERCALNLQFTAEDGDELEARVKRLIDGLPDIIRKITDGTSSSMYKRMLADWNIEGAIQQSQVEAFRDNLEDRWGEGLDLLRMLLTCCREVGGKAHKRHRRSKSKQRIFRRFVLTRLHVRACQVTDEIITLLENGFADGAMARWRTLHELAVVATVIADGDEKLAERYVNHDFVDVKRQADDYQRVQVPMGHPPISARELRKINTQYEAALERYGQTFASPYGWAAEKLNSKRPTFDNLQEEAGRGSMSSLYKMASYNVHAGARSMFHRLATMGDEDLLLSGRSNAGLVEPARNTAHSLMLITGFMEDGRPSLERNAEINAILHIRDAVSPAFDKANRKLQRDDRALRKAAKRN